MGLPFWPTCEGSTWTPPSVSLSFLPPSSPPPATIFGTLQGARETEERIKKPSTCTTTLLPHPEGILTLSLKNDLPSLPLCEECRQSGSRTVSSCSADTGCQDSTVPRSSWEPLVLNKNTTTASSFTSSDWDPNAPYL